MTGNDFDAYKAAVDGVSAMSIGVRYAVVKEDLHGGDDRLVGAFQSGMRPDEFVMNFVKEANLVAEGNNMNVKDRHEVNIRRAALIAFARENGDWKLGQDGAIYRAEDDGGVARMIPAKSRCGTAWRFGVEMVEGASLEIAEDGRVAAFDLPGSDLVTSMEIGDAVQKFENKREATAGMGMR